MSAGIWSYERSQNEFVGLEQRVRNAERVLTDALDADNAQLRNKLGIEAHAKIERATGDLDQLFHDGDARFLVDYKSATDVLQRRLSDMLAEVLDRIFKIPPDRQKQPPEPTGRVSIGPWRTVETVEAYSNGDVAGITIKYHGIEFTGSAKRNPVDKPDPAIGLAVAEARAARLLAKALQKKADKLVADAEAERQRQKRQAAARRKGK